MKRGILLILLASIAFAAMASAQQDELTVRFRSVGQNATIDLRLYLGESTYYIVSKTTNVKVTIDQKKGLAYIEAAKGWEGTESIYFTTIEAQARQPNISESKPPTPPPPLVPEERPEEVVIQYEEPLQILREMLDISLIDLVKDIRKEEIRTISKKASKDEVNININDEVNINIQKGYKPEITMDFSLVTGQGTQQEEQPAPNHKRTIFTLILINILIVFAVAYTVQAYLKHKKAK